MNSDRGFGQLPRGWTRAADLQPLTPSPVTIKNALPSWRAGFMALGLQPWAPNPVTITHTLPSWRAGLTAPGLQSWHPTRLPFRTRFRSSAYGLSSMVAADITVERASLSRNPGAKSFGAAH